MLVLPSPLDYYPLSTCEKYRQQWQWRSYELTYRYQRVLKCSTNHYSVLEGLALCGYMDYSKEYSFEECMCDYVKFCKVKIFFTPSDITFVLQAI